MVEIPKKAKAVSRKDAKKREERKEQLNDWIFSLACLRFFAPLRDALKAHNVREMSSFMISLVPP
jgi:hypothetical protein